MTDDLDNKILAKVKDGFHTAHDVALEIHEPENKVRNHMLSMSRFGMLDRHIREPNGNLRVGYWFTIPEEHP